MITSTMRALTFSGPSTDISRTGVTVLPTPLPGPGEVLIRITHAGINFKDVMMRRGDPGYVPVWPVIPGLEVAGVVERFGDGVDDLEVGMRVAALTNIGGLAEYVVASQALTARIPDGVPSAVAAVVPGVWTTAWLLLHEAARVRAGDTVLVHSAAGAVGAAIAAIAAAIPDTTLVGVVGAASRIEDARRAGYQHVFVRDGHLVDAVLTRLGGSGVDVVLDPQGTAWLDADLRVLAPTGRVVLFGNASGAPLDPLPTGELYAGNASVGGFSIGALSATAPTRVKRAMEAVLSGIAEGSLAPEVTVAQGLDQAAARQQQLADGSAKTKHVISINA
ncbi:zinc-binding dehydrogenase [Cryobacterium sp. SO2]|uniref:quinone oxidoreductase family protein n=1 Tax=Cryobacterium sp. SO2 TaxID=1897060 RepID=UPI00223D142F|nr:zinc-binding dehydrogenase [Cryobacterium sp. SO2]WEO78299.1 zinc-binding dehydrogenase [Cryobacterium sp. SO2]